MYLRKNIRVLYILFFVIFCLLYAANVAYGQNQPGFVPLSNANQSPMLTSAYSSPDLSTYFNAIFKIALSAGAILAVLRIGYAGFLYMGSDMWANKNHERLVVFYR